MAQVGGTVVEQKPQSCHTEKKKNEEEKTPLCRSPEETAQDIASDQQDH